MACFCWDDSLAATGSLAGGYTTQGQTASQGSWQAFAFGDPPDPAKREMPMEWQWKVIPGPREKKI